MINQIIPLLVHIYCERYQFEDPADINGGYCWDFADDLKIFFPEGEVKCNRDFEPISENDSRIWDHAFFYLNGRYYDSERPEGEIDWRNLPCCAECIKWVKS